MLRQVASANIDSQFCVPLRIVIVEDDPVMQLVLEQFLEDCENFQVIANQTEKARCPSCRFDISHG